MRSVIKSANEEGIKAIVAQQFDIAKKILSYGLIPIIEPEVDIHSVDKEKCEEILKKEIFANLDKLDKYALYSKIRFYKRKNISRKGDKID